METKGVSLLKAVLGAAGLLVMTASQASLVPPAVGHVIVVPGAGLGNVSTLLTIHDTDGSEAGMVVWDGTQDVPSGDTNAPGPNVQNKTYTFGDLLIDQATEIRIVFNPAEPGQTQSGISLDDLVMTIYTPGGVAVWNSGAFAPTLYSATTPGTGTAGFVFILDNTQAAAAQQYILAANRIGLSAAASMAQGGNETFFIYHGDGQNGGGGTGIPEPSSIALLGLGMLGAGLARRRRSK